MDDEILDVVNGHDQVVGTINRKDYNQLLNSRDRFIRASNMFILNDDGRLWIPTRTAHKTIAPNGYDFSAAGHVSSGDNYLDTIVKEAKEEIGLDIEAGNIEFVAITKSFSTRYFCALYLLRSNETPAFNNNDFVKAAWLSPDEVLGKIDGGHTAKSDLRKSVVLLQAYLSGT